METLAKTQKKEQEALALLVKILSFDQSTSCTGWAFWEDDQLNAFGHLSPPQKIKDIHEKISFLKKEVSELCAKSSPDVVVFEDIQLQGGNVTTFQKLAWLQGVLINLCGELNLPHEVRKPSEWRKDCNFLKDQDKDRQTQKKIAQEWVKEKCGKDCTSDEADAICIGWAEVIRKRR